MNVNIRTRRSTTILAVLALAVFLAPGVPVWAQSTATVSGTIRHKGSPVPGVLVQSNSIGGGQAVSTRDDGSYTLSGVPTGGWVYIHVRAPADWRLVYRNWRVDRLTGDLVKDFDLESGYRVSGEFRQPDGAPYGGSFWLGTDPIDFSPPEGEWVGDGAQRGKFDLVLLPGRYVFNCAPVPYFLPPTVVDLRHGEVTGLVITLLERREALPTMPPRASLITVSAPDTEGYATVTGAAGAVEPNAQVAVINLNAHTLAMTSADAGGGFSAVLYAPPGSSLLVKHDAHVYLGAAELWQQAQREHAGGVEINPWPGTILHVGGPLAREGGTQQYHGVGAFLADDPKKGWAGWWLSGAVQVPSGSASSGLRVRPGEKVRLTARLRVTSPALRCAGTPSLTLRAEFGLYYLFGADGRAQNSGIRFNAYLFTPTGLPIEHENGSEYRPVVSASLTSLACASTHAVDGVLDTTFTVPDDLRAGIYSLRVWIESGGVPLDTEVPLVKSWYHNAGSAFLPPLTIGAPAPPRIPWVLLGDYPVNGQRGIQAREDQGRIAMVTRVVFPPHQVVIPRLDERTGEPVAYWLEPGSPWLSSTDRRQPNPPCIPLALPSGQLTVQVRKPDGFADTLGPAIIRQSAVRTPTTPGGAPLDEGSGQVGDIYHLTTMNEVFRYRFSLYGQHVVTLSGEVKDVYGNAYAIQGTYDVFVARALDLDPAQLPTTPYMQGDAFAPGLHIFPPLPADVTIRLVHMPFSDAAKAVTRTIRGHANRFGYFQPPPGTDIPLETPGEFCVDISAVYTDVDGTLWVGAMTWGNVVEGRNAQIEAHGRRGMDYSSDTIDDMPAWFEVFNLPKEKVGVEVYYPYFSGDVHWGNQDKAPGDSIHPTITLRDKTPGQRIYQLMRNHWPRARTRFRQPPPEDTSLTGLNKRLAVGEAPLVITTASGADPTIDPNDIDLWGYWYGSSERPDVRVREIISEDNIGTAYWRFNDTYGYQLGEGALGDLAGDIKWEFGGAVFRVPGQSINEYAIYSSLWVLLPDNDPVGARVTPPFQDSSGASINGGPIMKLKGKDVDMLFLPKSIRPGDVLEMGDVVAFSGHVGPPLDSVVAVTITSPSGAKRSRTFRANKIGWVYDPSFDFAANEAGRWTVYVYVLHDRPYVGNGVTPASHNTGTVLGTDGSFEFYVVPRASSRIEVSSPSPGFLAWPNGKVEPIEIRGVAPPGATVVLYTIHDKGVVIAQGSVQPDAGGGFSITYDAKALNAEFPFISLTAHEGRWEGLADEVSINLLAVGGSELRANTVTLIGEEVFIGRGP